MQHGGFSGCKILCQSENETGKRYLFPSAPLQRSLPLVCALHTRGHGLGVLTLYEATLQRGPAETPVLVVEEVNHLPTGEPRRNPLPLPSLFLG